MALKCCLGDEEAASKFAEIARAYDILSDATKRQIYDQQGEDEVERYEQYAHSMPN